MTRSPIALFCLQNADEDISKMSNNVIRHGKGIKKLASNTRNSTNKESFQANTLYVLQLFLITLILKIVVMQVIALLSMIYLLPLLKATQIGINLHA